MDVDARMREELSPRGAQRTTRGHALITGGWALRVAGMAVGLAGFLVARASFYADQLAYLDTRPVFWWLRLLAGVAAFFAGLLVFWTGRRLIVRGKQHTADIIDSFDRLTGTRYVLYLRPFSTDPEMASLPIEVPGGNWGESAFFASGLTQEEALVRRFRRFGRVIGIGSLGEPLPLTGAVRAYLPVDDWKSTVTGLIGGAHVVLLSAGPGPGTVWEFTEALRVLPPTRLVLLAYCDPATYARFRTAVAEEYARRSGTEPGAPDTGRWPPLPALPDFPPLARPRRPLWETVLNGGRSRSRWDFHLKGLVAFGPTWRGTFIRFDPSTLRLPSIVSLNRLVTRQLKPVMVRLATLPARGIDPPAADGRPS
ncbi:hypothetical protein [Streptomyces jumonjinensis]|uniref:hypothetical protein n=1 Tax=Streptomyces jumonjinensis TaxID=1945 RepID=UPI0037992942